MNAVAHMIPMPRGPIKGTLSDADVKSLLVRAATARSIPELHAVIKTFVLNRLALVQVIEPLTAELIKSKSAVSSQFDIALLEELKVLRTELDVAQRQRDQAISEAKVTGEKLLRLERTHDVAQRLSERVQRELLLANMERERLGQENSALSAELDAKTLKLQLINEEVTLIRARLVEVDAALAHAINVSREAIVERNALRIEVANSTGNVAELKRQLAVQTKLAADRQKAVKRHVTMAAEYRRLLKHAATQFLSSHYHQSKATTVAQQPIAAAGANVVAFTSRAELDRLRDQLRSRDTAIATKDQAISQLTSANGLMKTRISEIESRFHQIEAVSRAQSVAHEEVAKTMLALLPEEQRDIYSSPSYDASSLMLIADAVKRHREEQLVAQHYRQDGVGQSL